MLTRSVITLAATVAAAVLSLAPVAWGDTYSALPGDSSSLQAALDSAAAVKGA
jgi:hypothetical protein